MFKDNQSGRSATDDADGETLDILLQYIYSGAVARAALKAEEVLKPADDYEMLELRDYAVRYLCNHITAEKAHRIFVEDDRRNLGGLGMAACLFIARNWESLRHTDDVRNGPNFGFFERFVAKRQELGIDSLDLDPGLDAKLMQ